MGAKKRRFVYELRAWRAGGSSLWCYPRRRSTQVSVISAVLESRDTAVWRRRRCAFAQLCDIPLIFTTFRKLIGLNLRRPSLNFARRERQKGGVREVEIAPRSKVIELFLNSLLLGYH